MRLRVLRILDLSDRRTCLQRDFAPLGSKQCALGYRRSTNRLEGTVLRGLLVVSHFPRPFVAAELGESTSASPGPAELRWPAPRLAIPSGHPLSSLLADAQVGSQPLDR